MNCRTCQHYLSSEDANQRAWLKGYGYCKAAPNPELRAHFFADESSCWLVPNRYQERK